MKKSDGMITLFIAGLTIRNLLMWTLAIVLFIFFVNASYRKFSGNPVTSAHFQEWGYSHQLLKIIACIELAGAIMLLIPITATSGAWMLSLIMVGATYTLLQHHVYKTSVVTILCLMLLVLFGYLQWTKSWVLIIFKMNAN